HGTGDFLTNLMRRERPRRRRMDASRPLTWNLPDRGAPAEDDPRGWEAVEISEQARGTLSEGTDEGVGEAAAAEGDAAGVVEEAGHFRVYLGAAAGVGKTYAMLCEGRRRQERGADVVIGFVECHGRRRTEKLIEGLEVVPRKTVEYRGSRLGEMDLAAVLRRQPKIALIDELAHRNVPGAGPHERRRTAV